MVAMSDFFGENQQVVHVSWCPCRRQILGELVKINFHLADNIFAAPYCRSQFAKRSSHLS